MKPGLCKEPAILNMAGPVLLIGLAFLFFKYLHGTIEQADAVSYMLMAKSLAGGDFSAIWNAYWSPLFSMFIAPFIFFGADPVIALKMVQLLLVLYSAYSVSLLLSRCHVFGWKKWIIIVCLYPAFLNYGFRYSTPDLLFLTIAFQFCYYITFTSSASFTRLVLCMIALILCKGVAMLFIPLLLLALFFPHSNFSHRKKYIKVLAIYLVCMLIYISGVSLHQGKFTIPSGGTYNFALLHPDRFDVHKGVLHHPLHEGELYNPTSEKHLNIWQNPSSIKIQSWKPWQSKTYFIHYADIVRLNAFSIYYLYISNNIGLLFILFLSLLLLTTSGKYFSKNTVPRVLLRAMIVLGIIYGSIFFSYRYIWFLFIASILIIACFITTPVRSNKVRKISGVLLCLSLLVLAKNSTKELLTGHQKEFHTRDWISLLSKPIKYLNKSVEENRIWLEFCRNQARLTPYRFFSIPSSEKNILNQLLYSMYGSHVYLGALKDYSEKNVHDAIEQFNPDYIHSEFPLDDRLAQNLRLQLFSMHTHLYIYRIGKE